MTAGTLKRGVISGFRYYIFDVQKYFMEVAVCLLLELSCQSLFRGRW